MTQVYPNRIVFLSDSGRREEARAAVAVNPGYFCKLNSDGTISPQTSIGSFSERMIAEEQALRGYPIGSMDQYAIGDLVQLCMLEPGDVVWAKVPALAAPIVPGNNMTSTGDGTLKVAPLSGVLYENTANSVSPVTSSTAENPFATNYTLPANSLAVGDQLRIRGLVKVTNQNSTDTLTLKLKIGSVVVEVTAAVDVATSDIGFFDALVQVLAIGASGSIVASGTQTLGTPGTAVAKPINLDPTTIDTTAANLITMTGQMSVSNAANVAVAEQFSVELVRSAAVRTVAVALDTLDNSAVAAEAFIRVRMI